MSLRNRRRSSLTRPAAWVDSCEPRMLLSSSNELGTALSGTGSVRGTAEFETEVENGVEERSFEVEVYNAAPNANYTVSVDGVAVGAFTTNSVGKGKLEFDSDPDSSDGEVAFPNNFPTVSAGTTIAVGDIATGTLQSGGTSDDSDDDDRDDDDRDDDRDGDRDDDDDGIDNDDDRDDDDDGIEDDHDDNGTEIRGVLTGASGGIGEAEFESEIEHGATEREFEVEVRGLEPQSVHAVVVNGVEVGSLTVNERGYGRLELSDSPDRDELPMPANFPAIADGSSVSVGGVLSGTISASNPSNGTDDSVSDNETHLRLNLTSTGTSSGRASFETELDGDEFKVEIWNAVPGETLPVVVDGVTVGQILVNRRGYGRLELETTPSIDDSDSQAFPANWPGITDGSLVTVGTELSGNFSGTGTLANASALEFEEAYVLDQQLELRAPSNMFENWGGLGEKWLVGDNGWYFITPDGTLTKWTGPGATGDVVATLDASFYDNPELLYESDAALAPTLDDEVARLSAAELDHDLNLRTTGNYYEDWGGEGEKWIRGDSGWYFILPDGSLHQYTREDRMNGPLVAGFDARFHADPSLLTEALSQLTVEERAYAIDAGLQLRHTPSDFFNWAGRNEKWVRGAGRWFFITEDGGFYAWNGSAEGILITTLSSAYYDDLDLLVSSDSGTSTDPLDRLSLLDRMFAEFI